jgi:ABC-type transporter MlaC component
MDKKMKDHLIKGFVLLYSAFFYNEPVSAVSEQAAKQHIEKTVEVAKELSKKKPSKDEYKNFMNQFFDLEGIVKVVSPKKDSSFIAQFTPVFETHIASVYSTEYKRKTFRKSVYKINKIIQKKDRCVVISSFNIEGKNEYTNTKDVVSVVWVLSNSGNGRTKISNMKFDGVDLILNEKKQAQNLFRQYNKNEEVFLDAYRKKA